MIVAHNDNYNEFKSLLETSLSYLTQESQSKADYYLSRSGTNFEDDVFRIVNEKSEGTIYSDKIELVSGQKFPDIVAYVNQNEAFGIEVKTTKSNTWKSTGSSIFEGTRVHNVKKIHLLFGKLSTPIDFRCKTYEECLYDVAITHSPRYLIDMELRESETIFSKVGVDYNTIRTLDNPFKPIKKYLRSNLQEGEDIWWIDYNEDDSRGLGVRNWNNLSVKKKQELTLKALAYFPGLLGSDKKKYARLATWLVSQFGIVNHALRDSFTAGGQIQIGHCKFPRIFTYLQDDLTKILNFASQISLEDIEYYWESSLTNNSIEQTWKNCALKHCEQHLDKNQYAIISNIISNDNT